MKCETVQNTMTMNVKILDSVGDKGSLQLSSPKPAIECTCAESLKAILYRYFTAVSNIAKSALSIMIINISIIEFQHL